MVVNVNQSDVMAPQPETREPSYVLYRQINPTYDDTPGIIPEVNKPPSPL